MAAASRARRLDPQSQITVYEASKYVSYSMCGIPYYISGLVSDLSKLVAYSPEQFKSERRIDVLTQARVISAEAGARKLRFAAAGGEREQEYDVLILATGAKPWVPGIDGILLPGVHTVRQLEDAEAIRSRAEKAEKVVIVGAGYSGLELSESFRSLGKDVTVLESLPRPMENLDPDMSELVTRELTANGVKVAFNTKVTAIEGKDNVERVLTEGEPYPADLVIMATGVRPDVDLARMLGVEMGTTGAIKVDERTRTNVEGVLAAGDNVEVRHLVTGKPTYIPLAQTANKMGFVAGANAAGKEAKFLGVVGSAVTKVFDLEIGRTGLTVQEAGKSGLRALGVTISSTTRAHYDPDSKKIWVRLNFEEGSQRLLGGQVLGQEGVWGRTSVLSMALHSKSALTDLLFSDMPYAPPFGPVWDPLVTASRVGLR
jgi:NADPH-dependent 2,4-dienoyl-CoA reductase/sulfur reductase-like enzyme